MDAVSEQKDRDEQDAAREYADAEADRIGRIWKARFPKGKDWPREQT